MSDIFCIHCDPGRVILVACIIFLSANTGEYTQTENRLLNTSFNRTSIIRCNANRGCEGQRWIYSIDQDDARFNKKLKSKVNEIIQTLPRINNGRWLRGNHPHGLVILLVY
jgi:hypothetical protein